MSVTVIRAEIYQSRPVRASERAVRKAALRQCRRVLTEKIHWRDRGNRRCLKIARIPSHDPLRLAGLCNCRDDRVFKILKRKLPCSLPSGGIKISDPILPQNSIHRRLRIGFRRVFSDKVLESSKSVCRTDSKQLTLRDQIHHLRRREIVRLAFLEHVQKYINVESDNQACFFST